MNWTKIGEAWRNYIKFQSGLILIYASFCLINRKSTKIFSVEHKR